MSDSDDLPDLRQPPAAELNPYAAGEAPPAVRVAPPVSSGLWIVVGAVLGCAAAAGGKLCWEVFQPDGRDPFQQIGEWAGGGAAVGAGLGWVVARCLGLRRAYQLIARQREELTQEVGQLVRQARRGEGPETFTE